MALTGAEVRQSFIDFFETRGHTHVPSASLVPGGDSTLLFTNAGMVQFKDVFLGTDIRPYTRAVDSQKCMRVSGKHNDLDQVGRDNTHHTFFEMLGNWSFGDYYKKEAIAWSWELLTEIWRLDKSKLWATTFKDEKGEIPDDAEASQEWLNQPGFDPTHLVTYGREDNFWEMAETGPCGPCSEIHYDFGPQACQKKADPNHHCHVNAGCGRWTELWNNVFIQYNRLSATELKPLPKRHVDTGMGFERIVSVIQGVNGNYATDLLAPLLEVVQGLTGHSEQARLENITPYRVIADHVRAATFLIADGVIPGNLGRNYVCRMIIRRAARFARKISLNEPFMAKVAEKVIRIYEDAYPEVKQNEALILETITREENRFSETLDAGFVELNKQIAELKARDMKVLDGKSAFDLYATLGFPLEITRDILTEAGLSVDEEGFYKGMEEHRLISGSGKAFREMGGENAEYYQKTLNELIEQSKLNTEGVMYDPYDRYTVETSILAIFQDGVSTINTEPGQKVEVMLADTSFYMESGGQVSDKGRIVSDPEGIWEIAVEEVQKPAAGVIVHIGTIVFGTPKIGDKAIAAVDIQRRIAIMRNHTATHLLHAELRKLLGPQIRQAGSLVAPDRLRFDFNYPGPLSQEQLAAIELGVNQAVLGGFHLNTVVKPLQQAMGEGAMALFGEKYGAEVRTIQIGDEERVSYELCGGTHVHNTSEIGLFLITGESSVAAGIRRIEAVTGSFAYEFLRHRLNLLQTVAREMGTTANELPVRLNDIQNQLSQSEKEIEHLRRKMARTYYEQELNNVVRMLDIPVMATIIPDGTAETLRELSDLFKQHFHSGVVVLGTVVEGKPLLVAAVTSDLIKRNIKAGELIKRVAAVIGGGGGGRPELAQAGGRYPDKLEDALKEVSSFVIENLK